MTMSVAIRFATFNVSLNQKTGVFWPGSGEARFELTGPGFPTVSSDHQLVYTNVAVVPLGTSQSRQLVDGTDFLGGDVGALIDSLATASFIQI